MSDPRLPKGWTAASLSALVTPRRNRVAPASAPDARFIGMEHVEAHSMRILETVPAGSMKSSAAAFEPRDVLYGRLRPYLNKVVRPDFAGLCSAEFIVLPDAPHLRSAFLQYRLSSADFVSFAGHLDEGDRPRVDFDQIGTFTVLLPPEPEQVRIVAKIEELFSDLDAGVAALERVRANLKRYRAAVLKAAVEGTFGSDRSSLAPPPWKPIGEVIHDLEQGWSPKCESAPAMQDDEWAVMTTTAIQPLRFSSDENKRLPKGLKPRIDLEVRVGDMVITRAGPRTRAGVACLVRSTRSRLILCDKAYRFQCDTKQVRGAFLEIALNADPVLKKLDKMKTGISDSGVNLTQPRFRELLVPVPPLPVQDRIVAEVDRRLSVADAAETQVEHALQRAARLRQAILKRAFDGKLVEQDPTDEPAAALLERIKPATNGKHPAPAKPPMRRSRAGV